MQSERTACSLLSARACASQTVTVTVSPFSGSQIRVHRLSAYMQPKSAHPGEEVVSSCLAVVPDWRPSIQPVMTMRGCGLCDPDMEITACPLVAWE